jgi:hypothetical protein
VAAKFEYKAYSNLAASKIESLYIRIYRVILASAAKSELAALFNTAREMIPHQQTLIAMGWQQPKTPIQTDNWAQP